MMEIRAKARRLKQKHNLKLIVIDYLQLMSSGRKVESRQLEVSEFSRQIKLLAKELGVPVVAMSQLNRGPEQRTDKKPAVSDLRESGSLEQDADIVILLHREDVYDKESARLGGSRLHRRQEPERAHPDRGDRLPGPLLPLRRHAALRTSRSDARLTRGWRSWPTQQILDKYNNLPMPRPVDTRSDKVTHKVTNLPSVMTKG